MPTRKNWVRGEGMPSPPRRDRDQEMPDAGVSPCATCGGLGGERPCPTCTTGTSHGGALPCPDCGGLRVIPAAFGAHVPPGQKMSDRPVGVPMHGMPDSVPSAAVPPHRGEAVKMLRTRGEIDRKAFISAWNDPVKSADDMCREFLFAHRSGVYAAAKRFGLTVPRVGTHSCWTERQRGAMRKRALEDEQITPEQEARIQASLNRPLPGVLYRCLCGGPSRLPTGHPNPMCQSRYKVA